MEHTAKWLEVGEHLRAALHVLAELDEELCRDRDQLFACVLATETASTLMHLTNLVRRERQLEPIDEWDRCRRCGGFGVLRAANVVPSSTVINPCDSCDGTGRRRAPQPREANQ